MTRSNPEHMREGAGTGQGATNRLQGYTDKGPLLSGPQKGSERRKESR